MSKNNLPCANDVVIDIMRQIRNHYGVSYINLCQCGAITFDFPNGKDVSVMVSNAGKYFTAVSQEHFDIIARGIVPNYSCCNHCVNHWGLDLCGCGSGENASKCEENTVACNIPSQCLEECCI